MSSPRITYTPHPDATPEDELTALANIFAFVLRCDQEREKGGPSTAPDDGTKFKEDSANAPIIPK